MSQILINDYLKQLDIIRRASGSARETIVREAFKDLLKAWGKQQGLIFLAEYPLKTATKTNIAVDGALLHELRMPLGYWEAKDADDGLDAEPGECSAEHVVVVEPRGQARVELRLLRLDPVHHALVEVGGSDPPNATSEMDVVGVVDFGKMIKTSRLFGIG